MAKIVKAKKLKVRRKPPHQPTPQELSKMSVKEIADLIIQTRDSLWPGKGRENFNRLDGEEED